MLTADNEKRIMMSLGGSNHTHEIQQATIDQVRQDMVDYDYHERYDISRIHWQDTLVRELIGSGKESVSDKPWIIFTGGPMGAGKTHVMRWLLSEGFLPLSALSSIDPDRIKRCMPEWKDLVTNSNGMAGSLTHKESGFIAEIAQEVALRESRNIWVDGSLRDTVWYTSIIKNIRKMFPNYRIAVLYVTAPRQTIIQRTQSRGDQTGRYIPPEKIDASMQGSMTTVRRLACMVDVTATIANEFDNADPVLVSVETGGMTRAITSFKQFKQLFDNPTESVDPWLALANQGVQLDTQYFSTS